MVYLILQHECWILQECEKVITRRQKRNKTDDTLSILGLYTITVNINNNANSMNTT